MSQFDRSKFIEDELAEINVKAVKLPYTKLIACCDLMVRFRINRTKVKEMDVCMQFPPHYPKALILVELKSKSLPTKFLDSVVQVLEKEKERFLGEKQVILVYRFILDFLEANPLCICAQEIVNLKALLKLDGSSQLNFLKVKQKQSMVHFRVEAEYGYFFEARVLIPDDYPDTRVSLDRTISNFPDFFQVFFLAQAKEIVRKCVEAPVFKSKKPSKTPQEPWRLIPSLEPVVSFLITNTQRYPTEVCSLCKKPCFPTKPDKVVEDPMSPQYIERIYCGHIFHYSCIDAYMKTPPFTGGKKCPGCEKIIYHEKWKESERTREERWAHKQAKQRELEEVEDFLS